MTSKGQIVEVGSKLTSLIRNDVCQLTQVTALELSNDLTLLNTEYTDLVGLVNIGNVVLVVDTDSLDLLLTLRSNHKLIDLLHGLQIDESQGSVTRSGHQELSERIDVNTVNSITVNFVELHDLDYLGKVLDDWSWLELLDNELLHNEVVLEVSNISQLLEHIVNTLPSGETSFKLDFVFKLGLVARSESILADIGLKQIHFRLVTVAELGLECLNHFVARSDMLVELVQESSAVVAQVVKGFGHPLHENVGFSEFLLSYF